MLRTFAKRSVGYLLLLAAVAIVVTWWARNDMAIQHDQRMRDFEQNGLSAAIPGFYDEDSYPEPSVAWYGLAALASAVGGVVTLERVAYQRGGTESEPDKADALA